MHVADIRDIFSLGFGPFRWVCCSGSEKDLEKTDAAAAGVFQELLQGEEINDWRQQNIFINSQLTFHATFTHFLWLRISILDKKLDPDVKVQYEENLKWIQEAGKHQLVVGSQARILYSDCVGRTKLAKRFNEMVKAGELKVLATFT
jgi:urocanate hydratase